MKTSVLILITAFCFLASTTLSFADNASRAATAMKAGRYDQAISLYQADLNYNPFDAVSANNIAVAYAMKRQYSNSLSWLKKASKMDASRQDISLNLDTLVQWLDDNSQLANDQLAVVPALEGALSPKPPAPW